jgi:hypothetical protein
MRKIIIYAPYRYRQIDVIDDMVRKLVLPFHHKLLHIETRRARVQLSEVYVPMMYKLQGQ